MRRVFAADFCDLFGAHVVFGERPQGDRSFNLRGAHAVGVGELARDFNPRTDDAAAIVLTVVVVVIVVGEIIAVHCEAVGVQACAVGERGCGLDGDVGSVGEGDGAGGEVEVSRVNNLLTREQIVQSAGVSLNGLVVDNVEHWFLLRGCGELFSFLVLIVACCGAVRTVCRYLVERALGVVLVMLVARMWAFERSVVRCWGSETV